VHIGLPKPERVVRAVVREWHNDLGWGVLGCPETPGGCWTHYSAIHTRLLGQVEGAEVFEFKSVTAGDSVELEWEEPGQGGFEYRAIVVRADPSQH
jgi:CspA family cold shock protein